RRAGGYRGRSRSRCGRRRQRERIVAGNKGEKLVQVDRIGARYRRRYVNNPAEESCCLIADGYGVALKRKRALSESNGIRRRRLSVAADCRRKVRRLGRGADCNGILSGRV